MGILGGALHGIHTTRQLADLVLKHGSKDGGSDGEVVHVLQDLSLVLGLDRILLQENTAVVLGSLGDLLLSKYHRLENTGDGVVLDSRSEHVVCDGGGVEFARRVYSGGDGTCLAEGESSLGVASLGESYKSAFEGLLHISYTLATCIIIEPDKKINQYSITMESEVGREYTRYLNSIRGTYNKEWGGHVPIT